jgi:hypothetical protein
MDMYLCLNDRAQTNLQKLLDHLYLNNFLNFIDINLILLILINKNLNFFSYFFDFR